jgi:hypothetical protein
LSGAASGRKEVVIFEVSSMTMNGNEPKEAACLDDIQHYAGMIVIFRRR